MDIALHTLICTSSDCDLSDRVDFSAPEWRIGIGKCLLQRGTASRGRVLVAFDSIQGSFGSIRNEFRGVVSKEALSHVDNWLLWRRRSSLIHNCPVWVSMDMVYMDAEAPGMTGSSTKHQTYHTSCLLLDTLAAGSSFALLSIVVLKLLTARHLVCVCSVFLNARKLERMGELR